MTPYYDEIRVETEERQRRMAERQAEQLQRHLADPHRVPMYLPVNDEEFPDESFTAGWSQEPGS